MTLNCNGKILDFEPMVNLGEFIKKKRYSRYLKDDDLSKIEFSQLKNHIQIQNDTIFIFMLDSACHLNFVQVRSNLFK